MVWLTAAATAAAAILLWRLRTNVRHAQKVSDAAGLLAGFALFAIGAESVLETLLHGTVFMTEVHQFLLNPVFLASGAYLGPYILTKMLERLGERRPGG